MHAPAPHGPIPSVRQLRWQEMEFYGFLHFTVNTFTDKEWGYGDESPAIFNPSTLDARQWARVASEAGMKGLIVTAKHHDGFCLWPSKFTEHSVMNSPWKDGKGDVVREVREACDEFGLKMGLYLSPWDRNHAGYGTPAYVSYYKNQLEELLTQYGELFEVWFDGANGGDGYYGGACERRSIDRQTYYQFPVLWEMVRQYQPNAVMFSDAGPDIRWVGNETGFAGFTCWGKIKPEGIAVGEVNDLSRLGRGEPDGTVWRPAEVCVSIRPGWFYHTHEAPKSLQGLLDIYFASVGYGCNLLLNLPPDRRGLIPEEDVARLSELRRTLDALFANDVAAGKPATASNVRGQTPEFAADKITDGNPETYWATDDDVRTTEIIVDLGEHLRIHSVRLEEFIPLGQRVEAFALDVLHGGQWLEMATGTTIGARRIVQIPDIVAEQVRVRILQAQACPILRRISVYS